MLLPDGRWKEISQMEKRNKYHEAITLQTSQTVINFSDISEEGKHLTFPLNNFIIGPKLGDLPQISETCTSRIFYLVLNYSYRNVSQVMII